MDWNLKVKLCRLYPTIRCQIFLLLVFFSLIITAIAPQEIIVAPPSRSSTIIADTTSGSSEKSANQLPSYDSVQIRRSPVNGTSFFSLDEPICMCVEIKCLVPELKGVWVTEYIDENSNISDIGQIKCFKTESIQDLFYLKKRICSDNNLTFVEKNTFDITRNNKTNSFTTSVGDLTTRDRIIYSYKFIPRNLTNYYFVSTVRSYDSVPPVRDVDAISEINIREVSPTFEVVIHPSISNPYKNEYFDIIFDIDFEGGAPIEELKGIKALIDKEPYYEFDNDTQEFELNLSKPNSIPMRIKYIGSGLQPLPGISIYLKNNTVDHISSNEYINVQESRPWVTLKDNIGLITALVAILGLIVSRRQK